MAVGFSNTNKPLNPRGQDASPKGYNRAALYSGKALSFDGVNDNVEVADNSSLDFTTAMSAFCYMRVDTLSTGGGVDYAISKYDYGNNNRSWLLGQRDDELIAVISKNGFSGATNTKDRFSATFENTSDYYFVGFTFESNVLKLYVNGQEVATEKTNDAEVNSIYSGNADVCVGSGQFNGSGIGFLDGKVANAKIFNTALTAAQVADLYNNPEKVVPTGLESNLKLWLPMMEGAGTTAYDGSGNGNHGTISGATYVNGIGAPVAQSAVMDWNKGSNLVAYSEEFNQWTSNISSVTANDTTAPDGQDTADKWIPDSGTTSANLRFNSANIATGTDYIFFGFAKAAGFDVIELDFQDSRFSDVNASFNLTSGTITATGGDNVTEGIIDKGNGWYLCYIVGNSIASGSNFCIFRQNNSTGDGSKGYYLWGAGFNQASNIVPYVRTSNVIQGSDVLLPQGLTTGRDITGVNLFENVRKQGALNLDGNSWGKVHPNNSFSFGTGAFSMEAWVKLEYVNTGSYANEIITLNDSDDFSIKTISTGMSFAVGSGVSLSHTITLDNSWAHIVGVRNADGSMKLYINAVEEESNAAGSSTASVPIDNPVRLGTDSNEASRTYKDQIAQPRIYNRALTASEVLRNYNSGKNTYTND